jgi:hypothetical protein
VMLRLSCATLAAVTTARAAVAVQLNGSQWSTTKAAGCVLPTRAVAADAGAAGDTAVDADHTRRTRRPAGEDDSTTA